MKKSIFILIAILGTTLNAQQMENEKVRAAVSKLFVATDQKDWSTVEVLFAEKVNLDYSSMTGNPSAELTPSQITAGWKTVLPGFTFTHHQTGNYLSEVKDYKAHVFVYGTATHYLDDEEGSIWTVVGTYDFKLIKVNGVWRISAMTFNYKYQDGNTKLVQKAVENVKNL
ncbi:nuclear transport factor 2 family protein [Muricauda sp. 2012CJ35-5]|uniref:Nuclear transport factor 2 family protein n=1 Tax=Flagellimonas spongiicola TaxID=2942208 RepID=A0ABT0PSZ3_9FLAO|nr:nuclear transport factor 2 family protein [Allomuricauda spongiicola]MCL6274479.1 nuclear transport factor 2 family protein [Allomuricauda spongiicola]